MTKLSPTSSEPPWIGIPAVGPILRPKHAAEYIGYSIGHFYDLVALKKVPTPIKIGIRATGVPKSWLDAVIAGWAADHDGAPA